MVEYDRSVIQEFAQRLYRQAKTVIVAFTLIGVIAGAALGFGLANSIRDSSPTIVVSFCAILVGAIACWAGVQRSFTLRLHAQTALCQMMIESNTGIAARGGGSATSSKVSGAFVPS